MKERLDVLLVKKGFCDSREKAKRLVMAGLVYVDGQRGEKPGAMVEEEGAIFVKGQDCPYVSRGGLKLEKALDWFEIDLKGLVCADMGASTGGFTDCCLQRGAEKVYAMDVGYGQLDWRLRKDPRVVNMEKVNIRYLDTERFDKPVDFVSIDVSFISLTLILPVAWRLLKEGGRLVCLVAVPRLFGGEAGAAFHIGGRSRHAVLPRQVGAGSHLHRLGALGHLAVDFKLVDADIIPILV